MAPLFALSFCHVSSPRWCHVALSNRPKWPPKMPNLISTCQHLMVPCGMMISSMQMLMSPYTVSCMDTDVTMLTLIGLTTTLTDHIFFVLILFDEPLLSLEILQRLLRIGTSLTGFWESLFFTLFCPLGPFWASRNISRIYGYYPEPPISYLPSKRTFGPQNYCIMRLQNVSWSYNRILNQSYLTMPKLSLCFIKKWCYTSHHF